MFGFKVFTEKTNERKGRTYDRDMRQCIREREDWNGKHQAACIEIERLRAAAERVCWFDWSNNDDDAVAAIEALRHELKTHK